jgi:hypothetical protein
LDGTSWGLLDGTSWGLLDGTSWGLLDGTSWGLRLRDGITAECLRCYAFSVPR